MIATSPRGARGFIRRPFEDTACYVEARDFMEDDAPVSGMQIGHPEIAARFPDLHPPLDARAATVEANRCLNCFDAPCMGACPTHIDVPGFIKKIASGNVTGSARTILEANVLGASCSRVCPVEVLCEGACVMHGREEKPIEIGRLQRFAMETYYAAGGRIPVRAHTEKRQRVACVGAGPASLACAAELRQQGFQVTVMDRRPLPGGLNTYGVAEYKLRAEDSLREAEHDPRAGSASSRHARSTRARWLSWSVNTMRSSWAWGWARCRSWRLKARRRLRACLRQRREFARPHLEF